MKRKVIIIAGATATGKTALAIKVAKAHNGVVVNFDSLLFYDELLIGTARPTPQEMDGVPHFLVGTDSISTPLNAKDFSLRALAIINEQPLTTPIILVGGSGFYLQALLYGMYDDLTTPPQVRVQSDELYQKEGIAPFLTLLEEKDPKSFARLHANDHYRVRRAVEYFWSTGKPMGEARLDHQDKKRENVHNWDTLTLYLDVPKVEHYPIIQKRTQEMLEKGLVDEVKTLLARGFTGKEKPMESIGYKEVQAYLRNEYSLDQCVEEIFIATRQLAKSQRTWFKGQKMQAHHPLKDQEEMSKLVSDFLIKE